MASFKWPEGETLAHITADGSDGPPDLGIYLGAGSLKRPAGRWMGCYVVCVESLDPSCSGGAAVEVRAWSPAESAEQVVDRIRRDGTGWLEWGPC